MSERLVTIKLNVIANIDLIVTYDHYGGGFSVHLQRPHTLAGGIHRCEKDKTVLRLCINYH